MLRTLSHEETAPAEKRRGRRPRQQDGGGVGAPIREPWELNDSKQAMPAVALTELR